MLEAVCDFSDRGRERRRIWRRDMPRDPPLLHPVVTADRSRVGAAEFISRHRSRGARHGRARTMVDEVLDKSTTLSGTVAAALEMAATARGGEPLYTTQVVVALNAQRCGRRRLLPGRAALPGLRPDRRGGMDRPRRRDHDYLARRSAGPVVGGVALEDRSALRPPAWRPVRSFRQRRGRRGATRCRTPCTESSLKPPPGRGAWRKVLWEIVIRCTVTRHRAGLAP